MDLRHNAYQKSDSAYNLISLIDVFALCIKRIVFGICLCIICTILSIGINYLNFDEEGFQEEYNDWLSKCSAIDGSIESANIQLSALNHYCDNSPLMSIDYKSVVKTSSIYKVISDQGQTVVSGSGNANPVLLSELRASSVADSLQLLDLQSLLNSQFSTNELFEVITFKSASDNISIIILGNSEEVTKEWDSILEEKVLELGSIEKVISTTSVGLDQDVLSQQQKIKTEISDLEMSLNDLKSEAKRIQKERPAGIRLLKSGVIGFAFGIVVFIAFFAFLPALNGLLCTSKEIENALGVFSFGTLRHDKSNWISKTILGERLFASKDNENEYIKTCIKKNMGSKTAVSFISSGSIDDKDRLSVLAKECGLNACFYECFLTSADAINNISDVQMIIDIEKVFNCSRYRLIDLKCVLNGFGCEIDGCIVTL